MLSPSGTTHDTVQHCACTVILQTDFEHFERSATCREDQLSRPYSNPRERARPSSDYLDTSPSQGILVHALSHAYLGPLGSAEVGCGSSMLHLALKQRCENMHIP